MFIAVVSALFVLTVVVVAMVIRDATQYSPESPARLWATRVAVATIILWFASGLLRQITARNGGSDLLLSPGFLRGIFAIVMVWLVYRDEF